MSITINTTIDIDGPTELVWDVLTDFSAYGDWNPSLGIEGSPQVGARLKVHMGAVGGRGASFRPVVLAATPGRELRWIGRLGFGGIVDGEHFFVLTANADGSTRLRHGECYSGLLVTLVSPFIKSEKSAVGYEGFNRAFKQRVESVRAAP